MNYLKDEKFGCHSIMENVSLYDYMQLIDNAYSDHGGIYGQRTVLTTKSAKQIRERMVMDFKSGAVLPPIVIGIVDPSFSLNENSSSKEFEEYIKNVDKDDISIIDGMQRTAAMKEAGLNVEEQKNRLIRVEFWIVRSINDLIYRMLVLNTGQVPWNTRRQLEVVFTPIKKAISEHVPDLQLIEVGEGKKRAEAGQFQADRIIELFHIFSTRSEKFDSKQTLSEAYQKLDMTEIMSKDDVFEMFVYILKNIVDFDKNISKCPYDESRKGRFKSGKEIFSSQPVLVGLVVVLAQKIYGRPGMNYSADKINRNFEKIKNQFQSLNTKLNTKNAEEICDFLDLDLLNEMLTDMKGSKIGDIEREYFRDAFKILIEEGFDIESMTICWRP